MHSLFLHNQVVSAQMALHTFHTDFGDRKATLTATLVDGEPWFRGFEAAASIGHKDPRRAIHTHVGDEDKYDLSPGLLAKSSKITTLHISERGLCSLILSSKLPHAKVFKNWVLKDVLPTIRQLNGYIAHPVVELEVEDVEPIRTDTRCVHADAISSSSSSSSAPVDLDQKLENISKELWEVKHELYLRKHAAVTRERSLKRQRVM
jgi:prophage antirepressor-like protein